MGYATVRHRRAIAVHGPVHRIHRLSFSPFRIDAPDEMEAEALLA
jgi:ribonuclease HII